MKKYDNFTDDDMQDALNTFLKIKPKRVKATKTKETSTAQPDITYSNPVNHQLEPDDFGVPLSRQTGINTKHLSFVAKSETGSPNSDAAFEYNNLKSATVKQHSNGKKRRGQKRKVSVESGDPQQTRLSLQADVDSSTANASKSRKKRKRNKSRKTYFRVIFPVL